MKTIANQSSAGLQQVIQQAQELLEQEPYASQPNVIAPLLWALKGVLDREQDLDEAVLDQACDVLVRQILSRGRLEIQEIPGLQPLLDWFDEQLNYDDRVLHKATELIFQRRDEWLAEVIAGLRSPARSEVCAALAQASAHRHQFMGVAPIVTTPVLWALKEVVDRRESVGHALADEARELLMHVLWWDQMFIENAPEVAELSGWYHRQPDAVPLERLYRPDRQGQARDG
jgi:hypothetical protein